MKFYHIGMFIFIVQLFGGYMMANAGSFGYSAGILSTTAAVSDTQTATDTMYNSTNSYQSLSGDNPLAYAFGWFYQMIVNATQKLFTTVFPFVAAYAWIPLLLQQLGIPSVFGWGIFAILQIIMAVGLYQAVTGRDIER